MAKDMEYFTVEQLKARRAYFEQLRKSAKGKPEQADLDITVKVFDQLIARMEPEKGGRS